jgi:LysM domain
MIQVRLLHQVEFGDTMLDICIKYGLNMAMIMDMNPEYYKKDINDIKVGQLIRIQ